MAFGEHKAAIVSKAIEQPPTEAISASFLQEHPDATVVLDEAAAARTDRDQAAVGGRAVRLDAGARSARRSSTSR